jgi:hypothetical protein
MLIEDDGRQMAMLQPKLKKIVAGRSKKMGGAKGGKKKGRNVIPAQTKPGGARFALSTFSHRKAQFLDSDSSGSR